MASRETLNKEELRDFTVAFISLLEEDLNSSIFSDIKNIFRDVYRQKLRSILMASGSKKEVKIKCKAITVRPGEMSISSLTSEDDDALVILTNNSNVHIGSAIIDNIKKKNEDANLLLQIMVIDGEHQTASVPYSGIIKKPHTPMASLLFMNTVTIDDLPETNKRTSDKDGTGSDKNVPAGLLSFTYEVSSSGSKFDDVSEVCSRRRNPISTGGWVKQRKTGWTTDLIMSKSCEPCKTLSVKEQMPRPPISRGMLSRHKQRKSDIAVNQMKIYGTFNSPMGEKGFLLESQQESKVNCPCRRSLDEPSCLDAVMKLRSQMVHKTTDMHVRLAKLTEDTSRLFPEMTKLKTKQPETVVSKLKECQSWKAPFIACVQILRRMSTPEKSKTQSCEVLNKDPEKEIRNKTDIYLTSESKRNEGRDESEKDNFPRTVMQNPSNDNKNPLSNASVSVVDASLTNDVFVDIFEYLCQEAQKNSPSTNRKKTYPLWRNIPLCQITTKRKVTV